MMRHYKAGLAIPDLPLAYGKSLPPTDEVGAQEDQQLPRLDHTDLSPSPSSRSGCTSPTASAPSSSPPPSRSSSPMSCAAASNPLLRRPAILLIALLVDPAHPRRPHRPLQKPADIASLHVAFGALDALHHVHPDHPRPQARPPSRDPDESARQPKPTLSPFHKRFPSPPEDCLKYRYVRHRLQYRPARHDAPRRSGPQRPFRVSPSSTSSPSRG